MVGVNNVQCDGGFLYIMLSMHVFQCPSCIVSLFSVCNVHYYDAIWDLRGLNLHIFQ